MTEQERNQYIERRLHDYHKKWRQEMRAKWLADPALRRWAQRQVWLWSRPREGGA